MKQAASKQASRALFHAGFLLSLLFSLDAGGDTFLQNVS
jgi:hypothetical protein